MGENSSAATFINLVIYKRNLGESWLRCCLLAFLLHDLYVLVHAHVQHLIWKCLIWRLTKEETMEALSKHANINPIISCTVWNELEKENKVFFKEYNSRLQTKEEEEEETLPEKETNQILQKLISNSSSNSEDDVNA